jgi:hypothetical protein
MGVRGGCIRACEGTEEGHSGGWVQFTETGFSTNQGFP